MPEIRRQKSEFEGFENNAGMAGSSIRTGSEGRVFPGSGMGGGKEENPCFLSISPGPAPLRRRLSI